MNIQNLAALAHSNDMVMSTKEIAERTNKTHKNVIRDVRNMFEQLEIDGSNLSHLDSRGYVKEFLLPKDLCLTLVTGYDAPLRHAIIVRWEELEREVSPIPRVPLN